MGYYVAPINFPILEEEEAVSILYINSLRPSVRL
jgi:hypothetical protein